MVHLYACVETETTVFLILQYARYDNIFTYKAYFIQYHLLIYIYILYCSCGKLWDFVRLHYEVSDHLPVDVISNHICTNERINQNLDSNENIHESNETEVVENDKRKKDHQDPVNVLSEIYTEVPTVQLLEKSQKLLQSVNATLKRSNSIADRLNESKGLRHSKDTPSTNARARVFEESSDCTLSDIYCNKSNDIKINFTLNNITVAENLSMKSRVNEGSRDANPSSKSNSESSNTSGNIREAALNENCTIRNSNRANDSSYSNSTSKTVSVQNISADNMINAYKNNNIKGPIDRTNSNVNIDEIQYPHLSKENIMDEEKILWKIPEAVIRSWATEMLLALEALHQQNVLILDFKPDNILLDDAGHVRLTYVIPQRNVELSKLTHPYSSPECAMYSPTSLVTSATDVWSLGVILYELLTGVVCKIS